MPRKQDDLRVIFKYIVEFLRRTPRSVGIGVHTSVNGIFRGGMTRNENVRIRVVRRDFVKSVFQPRFCLRAHIVYVRHKRLDLNGYKMIPVYDHMSVPRRNDAFVDVEIINVFAVCVYELRGSHTPAPVSVVVAVC